MVTANKLAHRTCFQVKKSNYSKIVISSCNSHTKFVSILEYFLIINNQDCNRFIYGINFRKS